MRAFLNRANALWRDQRGATAIEYGLILALIVIAVLGALSLLANGTTSLWDDVASKVISSSARR